MPIYKAFGLMIESDAPLFELVAQEPIEADYSLRFAPDRISELENANWTVRERFSDGSGWLSSAELGKSYALRFSGIADFLISPDRRRIIWRSNGANVEIIRHLFLDEVLPRLLAGHDRAVLHASAVTIGNEAVAFLGDSGQGKSTLAVSLASQGYPLITDDSLFLQKCGEQARCAPSYPGVRLWDESLSALFDGAAVAAPISHHFDKYRLDARDNQMAFASEAVPLRKIYLLSPVIELEEIVITPLSPGEVFGRLLAGSYRLEVNDGQSIKDEFSLLAWIAATIKFARLSFPHEYSLLPRLHRAILEDFDVRATQPGVIV